MRIAEAAALVGVEVHVLRHWDDMGVVVPDRTLAGHREYSAEHVSRLHVLRACQHVGMSLREIRVVLDRNAAERRQIIDRRIDEIRVRRRRLADAESFLVHVVECRHDLLTRCPECSVFAGSDAVEPEEAG
ncbi:MerR family transcriptional regulator [Gordonia polyisoprenivorans]|uniref:MerR family transcriptional regulator n=1 Tax=Gordonia polyisoprenivorans TaxID=84595 RepID=UPI000B99DE5C|nr:MerR family transcriptional regulator [Gordonia polyisoprenivorans]OZC34094.1 MerR family transcriptional regulator [Gordonia polyisoprenivorans]UZF58762.1 MerR family transcriptional regulator [Gordonia polyisoprenivorans]